MKEGRIFKDQAKRMIDLSFWVGLVFFGLFLAISPLSARAAINEQLQFSGKLTNSNKTNVANGSYNFKFELYQAASGGSTVWTETWDGTSGRISVTDGLFSVSLGSHTSLSGVDFNSSSIYLQVYFDPGNDGTYEESFSTRIRLTSAPHAFNAGKLGGKEESAFGTLADDESVAGSWQFNEQLRFGDSDASNYVGFQAPAAVGTNVVWTLPSADGAAGQYLRTDGSGTLSWAAGAGGGASAVADLTDVNLTSLGDNELLQYDSASSKWINQTLAEAGIQSSLTLGNLSGTSNQVTVTGGTGAIIGSGVTLSLPQNIHTAATPTFAGLTLGSLNGVLKASSGTISGSATTSDLTEGSNLYFTEERTDDRVSSLIQNGTGLTWTYVDASNTLTGNVSLAGFNVDDLGDIIVTAVADNEVLTYDSASSKWINQTAAEAGLSVVGHTHTAGDVTDFSTEVASNTDVAANTAARHSAATVADSATVDFTITGQQISGSVIQSGLDHGSIGGLTDDDHTIYALLAGRAGGQTLYGGTGAGDDLTLLTTSNATKGSYILGDLTTNGLLKTTGGTGTLAVATADTDYQQVITWGDGLEYSGGTAAVDYNTTNLKITATELNTIQDIATSASPTFAGLALGSGNLTMTGSLGATGARLTKGWFTDLEVTNAIAGSITGNAATVTTNANLTGPITSVGNATSVASQTGTGSTFVMNTSPTLVTPTIGAATATSIAIGANTINTSEWANLDGLNQTVATTSSPTFANITDSGLTATRVTYAGTAGILQDSANMTFGSTYGLTLAAGSTSALQLSSTAGTAAGGILFGTDTTLYRSAADTLKTDDSLQVAANISAVSSSSRLSVGGEVNNSVGANFTPTLADATGVTTYGANVGPIFGSVASATAIGLHEITSVTAGKTLDSLVNLYIAAPQKGAGSVITDNIGLQINDMNVGSDDNYAIYLAGTGVENAISWQGDTNLYRSAADTLKTDGELIATNGVSSTNGNNALVADSVVLDNLPVGSVGGQRSRLIAVGPDASTNGNLAIATVQSDGTSYYELIRITGSTLAVSFDSATAASSALIIGSDANLYRSAADTLKTDDSFTVGANLNVTGTTTLATSLSGVLKASSGVISAAVADTDYQQVVTWGDGLGYSSGTASVDYNTTNLKITANQLDTIQSIATSASPTFANLGALAQGDIRLYESDSTNYVGFQAPATVGSDLIWTLPATDGGSGQCLSTDSAGVLSWVDCAGSSGAPTTSQYVTLATDASLTGERVLTGTSNQISITDNGANGTVVLSTPQNIHTAATPTFASLNLSASTNQVVMQSGGVTGTLTWTPTSTGKTITLPDASGTVAVSASGALSLSAAGALTIADAVADGSTKGAASFTAADFDASSGNISIDYTNGQAASGSTKGFLTSTDWTTFNNKLGTGTTLFTLAGTSGDNQTITSGNTVTLAAGTDITTTGGATDTVTIANSSTLASVTGRGATTTTSVALNGGITVDTSNFTVDGSTGAVVTASTLQVAGETDITKVNAAGGSADALTLSGTLGAMDGTGTDIFRGVYLNYVNADHTGGSFYGLDIAGITADAQATERAINIGAGWDVGLYIADATTYSLQLASTDGDAASGITFGTDTNLYRSAADTLKTDDNFISVQQIQAQGFLANRTNTDDALIAGQITTDTHNRLSIDVSGLMTWGSGSAGRDTTLYRSAADTLKTDDSFVVGANLNVTGTTTLATSLSGMLKAASGVVSAAVADTDYQQVITWGDGLEYAAGTAAVDYNTTNLKITSTELNTIQDIATTSSPTFANITDSGLTATRVTYAGTAGILQDSANMTFGATYGLTLAAGSTSALQLSSTAGTAAGGILFGTDTTLYRSAASILKTDDALTAAGDITSESRVIATRAADTDQGLLALVTGDPEARFMVTAGGVINFGDGTNTRDTNLYRSAANTLKTDDSFTVTGTTTLATSLSGLLKAASGVVSAGVADTDYQQVITWGDGLEYAAGTAAVDYNTTNLKITSTELNTIQDIATTSSPSFVGITASGSAALNGGITVDTTNFTVDGTTGAVVTASTLQVGSTANLNGGIAVDTSNFTVSGTTGATAIAAVNSAGSSLNALALSGTLGAMDGTGTDIFRGVYLNYTNANHTGGSFYGLDIAGITADAQATERAINIGAGWDVGLYIADATTYSLQLASTDGDAASGITFGTDTNLYRSAADTLKTDDLLSIAGVNAASGSANALTLSGTLGAFNGSDTFRGLYLNYTNANHTGTNNNFIGIMIENITGDAEATEAALSIGTGWDYGLSVPLTSTASIYLTDDTGVAAGGIKFATDTTLYRSAADTLKTDDNLVVSLSYISNKADSAGTSQFLFNTSAAISSATLFAVQNNGTNKFLIGPTGTITDLQTYSDTVGVTNRDLYVDNTGKFGYVSSSARYKKDIVGLNDNDTDWLYNLRPVSFEYIDPAQSGTQLGLIAEEVEQVYQPLVSYSIDDPTQPETVSYSKLVVPLLNEVQNLNQSVKEAVAALANKQDLIGDSLALNTLTASNITTSSGNLTLSANEGVVKVADSLEVDGAVIFHNNLEVKGTIAGASIDLGDQTSGQAAVSKNTNEVFVTSQVVKPADKIILTPVFDDSLANNNIQLFKGQVEENSGFYVKAITSQPLTKDLLFDWVIIK